MAVYAVTDKQIRRSINAVCVTSNRIAKHGGDCNMIFGFLKIHFVGVVAQKYAFYDCGRIGTPLQKIFLEAKRTVFSAAQSTPYAERAITLQRTAAMAP